MKQKTLPKLLFLGAAIIAFVAFVSVNAHAWLSAPTAPEKAHLLQSSTPVEQDQNGAIKVPAPDVALLSKLFDLAQKLSGSRN